MVWIFCMYILDYFFIFYFFYIVQLVNKHVLDLVSTASLSDI